MEPADAGAPGKGVPGAGGGAEAEGEAPEGTDPGTTAGAGEATRPVREGVPGRTSTGSPDGEGERARTPEGAESLQDFSRISGIMGESPASKDEPGTEDGIGTSADPGEPARVASRTETGVGGRAPWRPEGEGAAPPGIATGDEDREPPAGEAALDAEARSTPATRPSAPGAGPSKGINGSSAGTEAGDGHREPCTGERKGSNGSSTGTETGDGHREPRAGEPERDRGRKGTSLAPKGEARPGAESPAADSVSPIGGREGGREERVGESVG